MNSNIYDIGIVGGGISGAFALNKIAELDKKCKVILFDSGRPPMKRRHQIFGWLGCLPSSDGKLYLSDFDQVKQFVGARPANKASKQIENIFKQISDFKIKKDKLPTASLQKKINKLNFQIEANDYVQLIPKEIHSLSRHLVSKIEESKNIDYLFDEEVTGISKSKNYFTISAGEQEFKCKKVLFCVGRGGWKWAHKVYNYFGLIQENNIAKYGVRLEADISNFKDFNKSSCTLIRDDLEIGPFSWNGSVIPEDHDECAITNFRSNEKRWETDKVSFNIIAKVHAKDAVEEMDRISKLTFLLANDRVLKEKANLITNNKSKLSIMKEYGWLKGTLKELSNLIPNIEDKSSIYFPTTMPLTSGINVYNTLETDLENFYVAGESAGIRGIISAACTGSLAAENMLNKR